MISHNVKIARFSFPRRRPSLFDFIHFNAVAAAVTVLYFLSFLLYFYFSSLFPSCAIEKNQNKKLSIECHDNAKTVPGLSQPKMLVPKLMPPNGRGYFSTNSSHLKYNIPRLATDVSVYGCLIC